MKSGEISKWHPDQTGLVNGLKRISFSCIFTTSGDFETCRASLERTIFKTGDGQALFVHAGDGCTGMYPYLTTVTPSSAMVWLNAPTPGLDICHQHSWWGGCPELSAQMASMGNNVV
eukprot:3082142-Rhodomonas_salina.3